MGKANILVVEDETLVAASIKLSLVNLGYTVTSIVTSGEEAVEKAETDRPDLVLMDIVLEGEMDGIEAASQINSRLHIPFIYVTAYANGKTRERANETSPYGYLIKPFKDQELDAAIQDALKKHQKETEE